MKLNYLVLICRVSLSKLLCFKQTSEKTSIFIYDESQNVKSPVEIGKTFLKFEHFLLKKQKMTKNFYF